MELASARGPESLARVVQVPEVEVADLRSFHSDDPHHAARAHRPCVSASDRDDMVVHKTPALDSLRDAAVEDAVENQPSRRTRVAIQPHRPPFFPPRIMAGTASS